MIELVYTAMFGGKDTLPEFKKEKGVRYICFTDCALRSKTWEIIQMPIQLSPRKTARMLKLNSHILFPQYEVVMWIDSRLVPAVPLSNFFSLMSDCDFVTGVHPDRICLYEEGNTCKKLGLDSAEVIDAQLSKYRAAGYPENNGLVETGLVVRRHTKQIVELNNLWWHELDTQSIRDQISFNYCAWKLGVNVKVYPKEWVIKGKHLHRY